MFTNDESVKKVGSINQIVYLRNLLFLYFISYNLTSYRVHFPYWSHCWTFRKIFYKLNLNIFYSSHLCAFFSLLSDRTPGSRGRREFFHLTSWSSVCRPRTMIIWGQMFYLYSDEDDINQSINQSINQINLYCTRCSGVRSSQVVWLTVSLWLKSLIGWSSGWCLSLVISVGVSQAQAAPADEEERGEFLVNIVTRSEDLMKQRNKILTTSVRLSNTEEEIFWMCGLHVIIAMMILIMVWAELIWCSS